MKHIINLFLLLLIAVIPTSAAAQIKYSKGVLNINSSKENLFGIILNEWPTIKWTYGSSKFLRFDLIFDNPRIYGTGNKIVFYHPDAKIYNKIEVASVHNTSDAKAKEDIVPLSSEINTLLKLRPITFKWKQCSDSFDNSGITYSQRSTLPETESRLQYGFLAQEVEEVLPDIVSTNEDGLKSVNYIALIPLLVQSIQELNAEIEERAITLDQIIENRYRQTAIVKSENKILNCSPNPTTGLVTISTHLAEPITAAKLVITSLTGNMEKEIAVSYEDQTASTDVSSLRQGIYIVSLFINNEAVDFCRLVKE
ncbi:MAG: tail fiber domain-containing protein [Muribaculaceae bacterium]|nr:tail fiber domain-containing protein [Muribaculaceae bacterium]